MINNMLLIDDDEVDQLSYRRTLARSALIGGYLGFRCPGRALDHLRDPNTPNPDVILLDVNMPRMSGLEFLDTATLELGPEFVGAIYIMLTLPLDTELHDRIAAFDTVKAFLPKPLTPDHLQEIASAALPHRAA